MGIDSLRTNYFSILQTCGKPNYILSQINNQMDVIPFALFIAFLWGLATVIHKYVLKTISPKVAMAVGSIFYFICICIFVVYNWNHLKTEVPKIDKICLFWIAVASIAGFLAYLIYYYILKKHDSYVVSALINAAPVFTLLLAVLLLKEKINVYGSLGVLFIVIGVILLALNEKKY